MKAYAPGVALAELVSVSNVWLLVHEGRKLLVDTGHPLERPMLRWSLARAGLRGKGDLDAILLTHRHSDHAGNAAWLRETFACPVVSSEEDAPFLTGAKAPPKMALGKAPFYQEALNLVEDRFPARSPVDEVYGPATARWGLRAIAVPGHTEGSVMLYHEPTRTLFSGDAITVGVPPLRFFLRGLRLAYPGFSSDVERCRSAVREFLRSRPKVAALCAGHGAPLFAPERELDALAARP